MDRGVSKPAEEKVATQNNTGSNICVDTSMNSNENSHAINGVGTVSEISSSVVVNNHFYYTPDVKQ